MDEKTPAERLIELRKGLGMTQEEFAKAIGTPAATYRKWEIGASRPTGSTMSLIALIENDPKQVLRILKKLGATI